MGKHPHLEKTSSDLCPGCGGKDFHRSHRRWWEKLLGRAPLYRCDQCQSRFPASRCVQAPKPAKPAPVAPPHD